jgi:hypothetical protein
MLALLLHPGLPFICALWILLDDLPVISRLLLVPV